MLPKLQVDNEYVAELRKVSVVFINIKGVPLAIKEDWTEIDVVELVQTLIHEIQRTLYEFEGSINTVLVDDKGLSVLAALGLPPEYHSDDASRATLAGLKIVSRVKVT